MIDADIIGFGCDSGFRFKLPDKIEILEHPHQNLPPFRTFGYWRFHGQTNGIDEGVPFAMIHPVVDWSFRYSSTYPFRSA